jgi:hypothetical protein
MSMPVSASHIGAASTSATFDMLTDPGYYEHLIALIPQSTMVSLDINRVAGTLTWTQRIVVPESVPAMAKRVIGPTMIVVEEHRWSAPAMDTVPTQADIQVRPQNLPAQMGGHMRITSPSSDGRCRVDIQATVTVNVPLLGRQLETLIAQNYLSIVELRSQAALTWDN